MYSSLLFAKISTTGIRLSFFNTLVRKSLPPIAARVYKFKSVWRSMKIILPYPEHINEKTGKKKENKKCTRASHHGANEISTYFTWHTHRTSLQLSEYFCDLWFPRRNIRFDRPDHDRSTAFRAFSDVLESREIFTGFQCGFMSVCILKTSERRDTMLILTAGEARKRGWLLPGVRSLIYHCPLKYRAGTNTRGINRRRLIHGAGQVERWHILTFPTTHERLYIQKARYGEEMVGKKSYSGSHFPFS